MTPLAVASGPISMNPVSAEFDRYVALLSELRHTTKWSRTIASEFATIRKLWRGGSNRNAEYGRFYGQHPLPTNLILRIFHQGYFIFVQYR